MVRPGGGSGGAVRSPGSPDSGVVGHFRPTGRGATGPSMGPEGLGICTLVGGPDCRRACGRDPHASALPNMLNPPPIRPPSATKAKPIGPKDATAPNPIPAIAPPIPPPAVAMPQRARSLTAIGAPQIRDVPISALVHRLRQAHVPTSPRRPAPSRSSPMQQARRKEHGYAVLDDH